MAKYKRKKEKKKERQAEKKGKKKSSQRKERKATQTLAVVLGEFEIKLHIKLRHLKLKVDFIKDVE